MFDPIYIQRLLFFEPTMHEPLKNPNLFRTLRAPYPLLYGEKVAVAIPLPPPGERRRGSDDSDPFLCLPEPLLGRTKGSGQPSSRSSTLSPRDAYRSISTVLQSRWFAKYTHSTKGQQTEKDLSTCKRQGRKGEEEGGGLQKLAGNGRMVVLTSPLTCYLSNSPPSIK